MPNKKLTKHGNPKRNLKEGAEPRENWFYRCVKKAWAIVSVVVALIAIVLLYPQMCSLFPQIRVEPMSESRDPKNLFKSPIEVTNDGLLFKASKIEYFCNISSALTNTESKFKNFVTTYDQTPLPDLAPKESMTAFCSFFEFEEGEVKTVNLDFVVKYYFFGKRKKIFRYTVEKNPKDVIFWMSRSASEK